MRAQKFHSAKEKAVPIVVDECSRLSVLSTGQPVTIYQLDDQGKKVGILDVVTGNKKLKLHDVEQILVESKGDFQTVLEGPDPMDTTPLVSPVDKPLTSTQMVRAFYQNEDNVRALRDMADAELTWEDFKDLGDMEDGEEFFSENGAPKTRYEMQAEQVKAAKEQDVVKMKQKRAEQIKAQEAEHEKALEAVLKEKGYVKADSIEDTGESHKSSANATGSGGPGQDHDQGE